MYNKSNLSKLVKMDDFAPEVMKAFWVFDKALTTQYAYYMDIQGENARKAGAVETEIAQVAMVAAALRGGAAVTHATHALVDCAIASERCLRGNAAAGTSTAEGAAAEQKLRDAGFEPATCRRGDRSLERVNDCKG